MTDLTVLVPVKNVDTSMFELALQSLIDQSMSKLRILVLCADESHQVDSIVGQFRDDRIEIVQCEASDTITEQLNRGISIAESEFIARADADDINELWRLESQIDFLTANPSVAAVGTALTIINAQGKMIATRAYPETHTEIAKAMHSYNALAHPTVVFRKAAVQQAGGYDYSGRPAQDYELWSRMIKLGYQFANLSERGVRYRLHPTSVKSSRQKRTLRSTIDIKRTYWLPTMTWSDRTRFYLEHLLLKLPIGLVQRAFEKWQYHAAPVPECTEASK